MQDGGDTFDRSLSSSSEEFTEEFTNKSGEVGGDVVAVELEGSS